MDMLPVIGTFEGVDLIMDRLIKEDPLVTWPPSVFMNLALMPRPDVPTVQRFHVSHIIMIKVCKYKT